MSVFAGSVWELCAPAAAPFGHAVSVERADAARLSRNPPAISTETAARAAASPSTLAVWRPGVRRGRAGMGIVNAAAYEPAPGRGPGRAGVAAFVGGWAMPGRP